MTRQEYNEYRHIRHMIKTAAPKHGDTWTIRTNGSSDFKARVHEMYTAANLHPASVKTDPWMYDNNERIIYLYGADEIHYDYAGRPYTWEKLYTPEEHARFAAALK